MVRGARLDNYVTGRIFAELSQKIPNLLELINRDTHLDNKEHTGNNSCIRERGFIKYLIIAR